MPFLNLGKKDEHGRQRRIEHRGRYLRASRTGGVALRAQARAAGVNLTANTSRGFRVSSTPLKNTQLAMQNGRFVLRGRYGRGPHKLNLSKSGVTASTRNSLGTFNWVRPNRSSAKFAGVQVRGKKAAQLQMAYMLVMLVVYLLQLVLMAVVALVRIGIALLALLYRLALATPYAIAVVRRRGRNWRLSRVLTEQHRLLQPPIPSWPADQLRAGLLLVLCGWGRGRDTGVAASQHSARDAGAQQFQLEADTLITIGERLDALRDQHPDNPATDPRAIMAALAERMRKVLPAETLVEAVLQADEITLEAGPRTRLQEQLLEVFNDFARIRLREPEVGEQVCQTGRCHVDRP